MPRFPRWVRFSLPLAVVVALAGGPAVAAQEEEFDRVAEAIAEVRQLPLEREIVEAFLTSDELRQRLPALLSEDYPAAEADADARALAAFGLAPPGTDLAALYLELYAEQTAGFYDPETDEMFVVGEDDEFDAVAEFTYAHEAVHALQDQHLGLGDLLDGSAERSDDQNLALTALYEGDAMLGSLDYVAANPGLVARLALSAQPPSAQIERVPPILAVGLLFPYANGLELVGALRETGGWAAVDAAYADPPTSTEQVMHPEKYLDRDEPTAVALPDVGASLGAGWGMIDEADLGELQIAVLLADLEPGEGVNAATASLDLPEPALNAAAGWDGDRYALWAEGEAEVLVWRSTWDSGDDARAFGRALQRHDEERFAGLFEGVTADDVALVTDDVAVRIQQRGTEVSYVMAPTLELADRAQ